MVESQIHETSAKLRHLLNESVKNNLANCILLSGGLDTSIVAAVASSHVQLTGVTVSLRDLAPDVPFAERIAKRFGMTHQIERVNEEDVEQAIVEVVRIMRSFDPMEIRNDASILIGLRAAKNLGFSEVMTGDAADELFAGYSFLFSMNIIDLKRALTKMWRAMRFASKPLAESLTMQARLPFLDHEEFRRFAEEIPVELKIRQERSRMYGKWILRKAFEHDLPDEIVWRTKTPIEQGSGTSTLPDYFNMKISDLEFNAESERCLRVDKVTIRDKEHLFYFRIYRDTYGAPSDDGEGLKCCRGCGTRLPVEADYCRTCGAYPA